MTTLDTQERFISDLTRTTLALVLAGGRGSRLRDLTLWRAKPAVPFGGEFRIIDFTLSNCVNSGIRRIGVLTQYKAHSLILHIQRGWGHMRGAFGEFVELLPAQQRLEESWYSGTADAVYQNLDIIRNHKAEFVLVLAGDHVYKMDYGPMLGYHVMKQADVTVGCIEIPAHQASAFGVMSVDDEYRITRFQEKPAAPEPMPGSQDSVLGSMGIYIFNTRFLYERLSLDADLPGSRHDFGGDVIPGLIDRYRAYAYPFRDSDSGVQAYWRDVGTIDAYWEAHMDLISVSPELNLYDERWPIWTHQTQAPPAKFVFADEGRRGMALDSMVSSGCILSGGAVERSVLFSNVRIDSGALVKDSVLLPDVVVGAGAQVSKAILERGCLVPAGMRIGQNPVEDAARFSVSPGGVTVVTPEMLGQDAPHHVR